jgi:phage shock protein PspC (stress-responsive transcriptional regulator)
MAQARSGLMRSHEHRMLAGVCGGLAEWLGWSPGLVRVLFVLVSILSAAFPGIIVYLILWIVMPLRDDDELPIDVG